MSGPRVTTGDESMQDARTPGEFIVAVERRFGPIQFDLAAHRLNNKHSRYFAPRDLGVKYDAAKPPTQADIAARLVAMGGRLDEATLAVSRAFMQAQKGTVYTRNHDEGAYNFDSFQHSWSDLSDKFAAPDGGPGLLWLNCEWNDIGSWGGRCAKEAADGANVLLLTHVAIADWARDLIFGKADVSLLSGRLCFDGKNVLPKDCMLSHFWPGQTGRMEVWDWRRDLVPANWRLVGGGS